MQSRTRGIRVERYSEQFLTETDQKIALVQRERDKLNELLAGLEASRNAMAQHVLSHVTAPSTNGHSTAGSRIDALAEVLAAAPEPLTTAQMVEGLASRGVITDRTGLSASLQYAKRKGLAKNVERGRWALVTSKAA